jgi:hypothetical protein
MPVLPQKCVDKESLPPFSVVAVHAILSERRGRERRASARRREERTKRFQSCRPADRFN